MMTALQAQFVYSTVWSDFSPTYSLTSGISTTNAPGFIWAGYQPQLNLGGWPWSPNNLNIFLRGFGPSSIWTGYKIYEGASGNCAGTLTQILNGNGVSMIEANNQSSLPVQYAITGAYNNGCYYIGLDKFGSPIYTNLFPFPQTQNQTQNQTAIAPSKPVIVQDDKTTDFYIAGSFAGQLFVNRISVTGSIVWSKVYSIAGDVTPKDITVFPNSGGRLIVVGKVNVALGDDDAIVIDIDGSNGLVNTTKVLGNVGVNDGFNSVLVIKGNAPNASNDILLGGYAGTNPAGYESWLVRTSANYNIVMSSYLQPTSGANFGIVDLMERLNTFFNYEYYTLIHSASGMVVLKFDNNFQPFMAQMPAMNEFVYNLPGTSNSVPACISQVNSAPTLMGLGIQVYGTAYNITSAATSHMVQAYNNGETNCNRVLQMQNNPVSGLFVMTTGQALVNQGLSACANFTALVFYTGGAMNFPCTGFIGNGNNARSIGTAIAEVNTSEIGFQVAPNPANQLVTVNFTATEGARANLNLTDLSGRIVSATAIGCDFSGDYAQEINLKELDLKAGIYFVDLKIGATSYRQKLLVNN